MYPGATAKFSMQGAGFNHVHRRSSYPREGKEVELEHGQMQVWRGLCIYRHPILDTRHASREIVETHDLPRSIVQRKHPASETKGQNFTSTWQSSLRKENTGRGDER